MDQRGAQTRGGGRRGKGLLAEALLLGLDPVGHLGHVGEVEGGQWSEILPEKRNEAAGGRGEGRARVVW